MSQETWQMYRAGNFPANWEETDSGARERASRSYHAFKVSRTEVLEAGIYIEGMLDAVLCDAIAGQDDDAREKLQAYVLSAEFCTFFQKWRMLRALLKEQSNWRALAHPEGSVSLITNLKSVISARNRFAHGVISVDATTNDVRLTYREDGEKTDIVNDATVSAFLADAKSVFFWLNDMHVKFNEGQLE